MVQIIKKDITVFRGDNSPNISWVMPFDVTGSDTFTLIIRWDWNSITDTSAAGGLSIVVATDTVTWIDTVADTSSIPLGKYARYELSSNRAGVIQTRFYGDVTGLGGLTVDTGYW